MKMKNAYCFERLELDVSCGGSRDTGNVVMSSSTSGESTYKNISISMLKSVTVQDEYGGVLRNRYALVKDNGKCYWAQDVHGSLALWALPYVVHYETYQTIKKSRTNQTMQVALLTPTPTIRKQCTAHGRRETSWWLFRGTTSHTIACSNMQEDHAS
ncbi:hypothetical protein L195_g047916 [Trifolium pratense]|uniref:Uncharacterized protein n=1 Tax=Trifolium pratense TaxID=57577 RepID=A0A2K3MLW8_TRIPR|nr:hypothetical protein L195_g047916 [Trifolium pratense]